MAPKKRSKSQYRRSSSGGRPRHRHSLSGGGSSGEWGGKGQQEECVPLEAHETLPQLRRRAILQGLGSTVDRLVGWYRLSGVSLPPSLGIDDEEYEALANGEHRDSRVVDADVERCLWEVADEDRGALRKSLKRLLNAVVNYHAGSPTGPVHYYQGLHDIGAVLLQVLGERGAFAVLCAAAVSHLRDATRPGLDGVVSLLGFMLPLLAVIDRQLAVHLQAMNLPPFFAISWVLTWFTHRTSSLDTSSRLVDLFLAAHPAMPLYVGAVMCRNARQQLLTCSSMPDLHNLLTSLQLEANGASIDDVAADALRLFQRKPPIMLPLLLPSTPLSCVAHGASLAKAPADDDCQPGDGSDACQPGAGCWRVPTVAEVTGWAAHGWPPDVVASCRSAGISSLAGPKPSVMKMIGITSLLGVSMALMLSLALQGRDDGGREEHSSMPWERLMTAISL